MKNYKIKNYFVTVLLVLFVPILTVVVPLENASAKISRACETCLRECDERSAPGTDCSQQCSGSCAVNNSTDSSNDSGGNPDYAILNPGDENGISYLLKLAVRILTGLVAVAAVASIIYAGVQYASAGDDSGKVKAAKDRITQTVIGIILYMLMYVILEFLIPGGAFK